MIKNKAASIILMIIVWAAFIWMSWNAWQIWSEL